MSGEDIPGSFPEENAVLPPGTPRTETYQPSLPRRYEVARYD